MSSSASLVRQKYRSLGRLVNRIPEATGSASICPEQSWEQLRSAFREPLGPKESLEDRLKQADSKLAFLRMITPKEPPKSSDGDTHANSTSHGGGGRWVYKKNGKVEGTSARRDKDGKVHTNWDGKNLDPCSVKQHNYQLKRMGFRNNAHAKGFF